LTVGLIVTPGPGILLTIHTAASHNIKLAMTGIIGMIVGMLPIAIISFVFLKILLTYVPDIIIYLQFISSLYLFYLSKNMFVKYQQHKMNIDNTNNSDDNISNTNMFYKGVGISLFGPKPIVIFTSIIPSFINVNNNYLTQDIIFSLIFLFTIFLTHLTYIAIVLKIKHKLNIKYISLISSLLMALFGFILLYKTFNFVLL